MPLKFEPKILRYANLYFFIQNLSEWHFSNRKKYNEVWRSELSFSEEANVCLKEFRIIHEQYPFDDNHYLGRPFFLYEDPWPTIKLLTGEDNYFKIKNIFTILEPYFNTIYLKDEERLKEWSAIIAKPEFIEKASELNKILADFYECSPYSETCTIYLLLSTKEKNGGTAGTINDHSITLELSRTPVELEKQVLNIIWHELIHLYFRNCKLFPLLKEYTNNDLGKMHKIDELIASSLIPGGLLKDYTLNKINISNIHKNFNSRIASEKIISVQKLIYPYLKQKRSINTKLIEKLCTVCD
jgi:hypothetical protein